MAVLTGSRLSHVPDKAMAISSAPMISAQIAKYMDCWVDPLPQRCSHCSSWDSRGPSG